MRWIGRSIFIAVLLGGLYFTVGAGLIDLWQQARFGKSKMEQGSASTFFPLSQEHWLAFDVPSASGLFRFYAHAALKPGLGENPVSYTIDYQWLDQQGGVIARRQYHITTRVGASNTRIDAQDGNTPVPQRFYDHKRSLPSRDHALYFNALEQPQATTLRLRVSALEDPIELVGIRPYQQFTRSPNKVDIAWQRMSSEQREALSRGSLYPSFLLSNYERKNLLSNYWKPIGPLGVLDRDYTIGTLYQLDQDTRNQPPETPAIEGLFAGPEHWLSLVLRAETARYRISWQPSPQFSSPDQLQLLWQSVDFQQIRQWQAPVQDQYWEGELAAGLLQVTPDQAGLMKLSVLQGDKWLDITPEKRYLRAFSCDPDAPLTYTLTAGSTRQAIKVDARAYSRQDKPAPTQPPIVTLTLLDHSGDTLYQRAIELPTLHFPYQHFSDVAIQGGQIFEPLSSYFDASPDSQVLRIECSEPGLINVYNRPRGLPVRRGLPAEQNYWLSYDSREPTWFTLRPNNFDALIRMKRYVSLLWYFKPRGLDTLVSDGDYSWQAVAALDPDALELQVLTPQAGDSQSRMEGRNTAYKPVATGTSLFFAGRSNEKLVQASMIFLREDSRPQPVQIWIDQVLALDLTIAGKSGRISLPGLSAGNHDIEIRSLATSWFINNTAETGQTHRLRTAYTATREAGEGTALTFNFYSSGMPQQLGLWLYAPDTSQSLNCSMKLQAQRNGDLQHEHSLQDYQYKLAGHEYDTSHVLQRRETRVRGPMKLVIPLHADLPAQTMAVELGCDQAGVLASAGLISRGQPGYRYFQEINEAK